MFCFPITISVTCSLLFGILFWEAADHFVLGFGVGHVSCVRRMELILDGVFV